MESIKGNSSLFSKTLPVYYPFLLQDLIKALPECAHWAKPDRLNVVGMKEAFSPIHP